MLLTSRRLRAALLATASATLVAAALPAPSPLGIGDRLFPYLGNPGYDVGSYDIGLTYTGDNDKPLDATTTIDATATRRLDRFNLDFTHGTVRSVTVDGRPAAFATAGEDLVVTPHDVVPEGDPMEVTVHHTSDPRGDNSAGGWIRTTDGLVMANQANAAHRVFPCNDHPSDKAYFTFHVSAPKKLTVVANGEETGESTEGADTTWTYRTRHPMATELAQVSIGTSAVVRSTGPHGLPVRSVVPAADRKRLGPWLAKTPDMIQWMEQRVGRYPFSDYGVLIAGANTGFELETQTLSLFERSLFAAGGGYPSWYVDSLLVHELAHQWFGDSVSPHRWSDVWLNEGHATWYEGTYAQEHGGPDFAQRMHDAYTSSDAWRAAGGPPAAPKAPVPGKPISIFRPVVYDGSALVLYALRQEVGAATFSRIERDWVRENRDSSASSADFTALASRDAGRDLTAFFHGWLYGKKTPPMPGHPDWHSAAPAQHTARPTAKKPAHPDATSSAPAAHGDKASAVRGGA
ncbi:M1 family metallopeptidase [Streptomyces sp. NRRL F-5126]|uniref:M1 family metallopeptidase n=1 Tax=Streptomyces sp. NRRL F-5126 TaxID=1463857 RepID=UPI00099C1556|nr:M1 family metallopeptidase [Streptomyces sp. NRRL F-5126]